MRRLGVVESAKVQGYSRLKGRGGHQVRLLEPIPVQHPEGPLASAVDRRESAPRPCTTMESLPLG